MERASASGDERNKEDADGMVVAHARPGSCRLGQSLIFQPISGQSYNPRCLPGTIVRVLSDDGKVG